MSDTTSQDGHLEVGIVVRDLQAVTPFYQDGLGLAHIVDLDLPMGLMRRFTCGTGILKLMQLTDAPTSANPPGGMTGGSTGLRWFSFRVRDLEEVSRRCVAAGGRVAWPLEEWGSLRVMILEDPEANCWVEIAEQRE